MRISICIILGILALILSSCAEPNLTHTCKDNHGEIRECTPEENDMIEDVHMIIREVRNYDRVKNDVTWFGRQSKKPPRVLFYGESHPEIIGRIETLGAINAALERNDVLLLEGDDWKMPHFQKRCGINLIFNIYVQWQFQKLGRTYLESFKWQKQHHFLHLFKTTLDSYDLTGLSINDVRCGYWDNRVAIDASLEDTNKISYYLPTRNASMVDAIDKSLSLYDRVIINTGFAHMPIGDYNICQERNKKSKISFPKKRREFYRLVDEQRKKHPAQRSIQLDDSDGTTKVIYDYLKRKKVPYQERIHGRMLDGLSTNQE